MQRLDVLAEKHGALGLGQSATVAGLAAAAGLFAAGLLYIGHGFVDDSFIYFRYAEHLAGGHGLAWNIGEPPVEGHSSLLWLLLLSLGHLAGGSELPAVAKGLGILTALGALALAWRLAADSLQGTAKPLATLAPIAIAASPLLARHALNGLETALTVLFYLTMGWLWARLRPDDRRAGVVLGLAAFVGLLIRPDSAAFSIPGSAAALALAAPGWRIAARRLAILGLSFGAPVAAYLAWKLVVFGGILPLPALIKLSPPSLYADGPELRRILGMWLGFAAAVAPFAMLGLAAAALLRFKMPQATWPIVAGSAGFALYLLTTVPIMNFDYRLHFPMLPPVASIAIALWCSGLERLRGEQGPPMGISLVLFLSIAWLLAAGVAQASATRLSARHDLVEGPRHEALGRALGRVPGLSLAYSEAGRVPYYSRARVLDVAGLNDRFVALHWRAGDIDRAFETYLVGGFGLPDVMVRSPDAYRYAHMERLPALAGLYAPFCFDGLLVYLRDASPRRDAIEAALREALERTGRASCPQS